MPPFPSAGPRLRPVALATALAILTTACAQREAAAPQAMSTEAIAALAQRNTEAIKGLASAVSGGRTGGGAAGWTGGGVGTWRIGNGLTFPDSIALSKAQEAKIAALREAAAKAVAADSAALQAIVAKALAARAAGAPSSTVDSIMATGEAIDERLRAATRQLDEDVLAVLTPAQRLWFDACQGPRALSIEQAEQLAALHKAFEQETAADVAAIDAALQEIEALRAAGNPSQATEEKIQAILQRVLPIRLRYQQALVRLEAQIAAVVGPDRCGT